MQQTRSSISGLRLLPGTRVTLVIGAAAGLLAFSAAALAVYHLAISGDSPGRSRPARSTAGVGRSALARPRPRLGTTNLGIPYGATQSAVLDRLGTPTAKRAGCWIYRGTVGSIRGRYSGPYIDAAEFCFSDGAAGGAVVTQIRTHTPTHTIRMWDPETHTMRTKHFAAQWGPAVTIAIPPDWYVQENS